MRQLISTSILLLTFYCTHAQECLPGLNTIPMYGLGFYELCTELHEANKQFIADCDKDFVSRKEASVYHSQRAWNYFRKHDDTTAMKRFNQAWLLDDKNANVYWGFGVLLGRQKEYKQSVLHLNRAIELAPPDPALLKDAAISHMQAFYQLKDSSYLDNGIAIIRRSIALQPDSATGYANLAKAYTYYHAKDSVKKYLKLTGKMDRKARRGKK